MHFYCMFSVWIDYLLWCKADMVAGTCKLPDNMAPTWGIPSVISKDQGTVFSGQIIWALMKPWKFLGTSTVHNILDNYVRWWELMVFSNIKFLNLLKLLDFCVLRYCPWSCWLFMVPPLENVNSLHIRQSPAYQSVYTCIQSSADIPCWLC